MGQSAGWSKWAASNLRAVLRVEFIGRDKDSIVDFTFLIFGWDCNHSSRELKNKNGSRNNGELL